MEKKSYSQPGNLKVHINNKHKKDNLKRNKIHSRSLATLEIDTLILLAIILKIVSFHVLSLKDTLSDPAKQPMAVRDKTKTIYHIDANRTTPF